MCVSSWTRIAPNTLPAMAKSAANYMNSQLIKMEASSTATSKALPRSNGYVSEGSGENVFIVRNGCCRRAARQFGVAGNHAGVSSSNCRDLNIPVTEQCIPRELLYIADEAFLPALPPGHADSFSRQNQRWQRRDRSHHQGHSEGVLRDHPRREGDRHHWLTPVKVGSKQPVGSNNLGWPVVHGLLRRAWRHNWLFYFPAP